MSQKFSQQSPQRFGARPFQGKSFLEQQRNRVVSQEQEGDPYVDYARSRRRKLGVVGSDAGVSYEFPLAQPKQHEFSPYAYRKPSGAVYADIGKEGAYTGWMLRYQKPEKQGRIPRSDVFATDFGRQFRLSSHVPESRVVKPISEMEQNWDQQYQEFKLWRMITTSDLPQQEKEQLLFQVFPWAEFAYTQARSESASRKFYSELGYPQFGGKYQPFTVPKDAKIKGITETGEGLNITFESLTPTVSTKEYKLPKSLDPHGTLSEQFINTTWVTTETKASVIKPSSSISKSLYDVRYGEALVIDYKKGIIGSTAFRPLGAFAGIASNFESLVFGMVDIFKPQTIIGYKEIGTPERTPLPLEEGFGEMSEGYRQGAFLGSILVSEMISETIVSPLISGVGSELGHAFRGSRLEHAVYDWSRPEIVNKVDINTAWKEGAAPFMSGYEEDIGLLSKLKAWTYSKLSPTPMIVSQPTEILGQGINVNPKAVELSDWAFDWATTARSAGFGRTAMMAEPVVAEGLKETSMTLSYMPLSFAKTHWVKPTEAIFGKLIKSERGSLLIERPVADFGEGVNFLKDVGSQAVETSIKAVPLAISLGIVASSQLKFYHSVPKSFLPELESVDQPTKFSYETETFTSLKLASKPIEIFRLKPKDRLKYVSSFDLDVFQTDREKSIVGFAPRMDVGQTPSQKVKIDIPQLQKMDIPSPPPPFDLPRFIQRDYETKRMQSKRKVKPKKVKGLGAYKRKYPLATAEEFMRTFI